MRLFSCKNSSRVGAFTFQHFHSYGQRLVGLLLVDANRLGHNHLTEAALTQRFTQSEPEPGKQIGNK